MVLKIEEWEFEVDPERTAAHAAEALAGHCTCGYCENYYRCAPVIYPALPGFLKQFSLELEAPSEMYPFEPTLYLLGYRVYGRILRYGHGPMMVCGAVPVMPRPVDDECFMLEVGELRLSWVLPEDPEEVLSPANEPEFLDRMYRVMLRRGYFTGLPS